MSGTVQVGCVKFMYNIAYYSHTTVVIQLHHVNFISTVCYIVHNLLLLLRIIVCTYDYLMKVAFECPWGQWSKFIYKCLASACRIHVQYCVSM